MRQLLWTSIAPMVLLAWTASASAETVTYRYDEFSDDLEAAAEAIAGLELPAQPGFLRGDAFGQLYHPDPGSYPITIRGIDLVLAAAPNAPELTTHATIEIWAHSGADPEPLDDQPLFSVSTRDIADPTNPDERGVPLQGDTAYHLEFDFDTPDAYPPDITEGSFSVMIRFEEDARELVDEWNDQCSFDSGCGCQNVGALLDQATTPEVNLIHAVIGSDCTSTELSWHHAESLGVRGDFILRVVAETTDCAPSCGEAECGDDGCGGSCGDCGSGEECDGGACVPLDAELCGDGSCGEDETCESCPGDCGCSGGFECVEEVCVEPERSAAGGSSGCATLPGARDAASLWRLLTLP